MKKPAFLQPRIGSPATAQIGSIAYRRCRAKLNSVHFGLKIMNWPPFARPPTYRLRAEFERRRSTQWLSRLLFRDPRLPSATSSLGKRSNGFAARRTGPHKLGLAGFTARRLPY